ncbi:MAG: N-acetylglucosamine-6-phosphate deacetylase [Rhodoglobus sp.]
MTTYDLVLSNAKIVTPRGVIEEGWVGIRDGVITAIEAGSRPNVSSAEVVHDLGGAWLGPGFIDMHVHGSDGVDFMDTDEDGLRKMARFFASRGVTSFLASTYTLAHQATLNALNLAKTVGERVAGGANIVGVYMEGPYLSPERKGAHRESLLRSIDRIELTEYLDTGVVRALVVAPELADSEWLIHELTRRGVTAVAGHTDGTYAHIEQAVHQGVTAITHTFNGMRGLHHREPGVAGAALLLDDVTCEVIADGAHIAPELFPLFWRMKGAHNIALITDANQSGGLPDGTYWNVDHNMEVIDGLARLPDGTITGSAKTFDYGFALFCKYAGVSFDEAWPAASSTPARMAGVLDRKGTVELGKDADLTVLSPDGTVLAATVCGEWLPTADFNVT